MKENVRRAKKLSECSFSEILQYPISLAIRLGFRVYMEVWTPVNEEILICSRESTNLHDLFRGSESFKVQNNRWSFAKDTVLFNFIRFRQH